MQERTEVVKLPLYIKTVLTYKKTGLRFLEFGEKISIKESDNCNLEFFFEESPEEGNQIGIMKAKGLFKYSMRENRIQAFREQQENFDCIDTRKDIPATVKNFVLKNIESWKTKSKKLYETIRWRYGQSGADNLIERIELFWSEDKENWHPICDNEVRVVDGYMTVFNNLTCGNITASIQTAFANNNFESLAHKLIRESISLMGSNPRSSYAIGVTALEVGVKEFIMTMKPETEWLLTNMPSPNIYKLIKEYFPLINEHFKINDNDYKLIRKTVDYRNKLVHRGEFDLALDKIHERLTLIKDLIILMDYYKGNRWATIFLSPDRKAVYFPS